MKQLITYLADVIGIEIDLQPLAREMTDKLPMYLNEGYQWQEAIFANRPCIFAEMKEHGSFSIAQIEKHFELVKIKFGLPVIAVFNELEAYNRKRLIEKKLAFVVPGKQLYVPEFLIDLKEYGTITKKERDSLVPTAQQLLLFHLLDKQQSGLLPNKTFRELAVLIGTNPMGITRAAENLKYLELIEVSGEKEKFIRFRLERYELWQNVLNRNLWINPVLKQVFVDEIPQGITLLKCNASALPEYSDMNPGRQEFYAIEKNAFYGLQKSNALINANKYEGRYCLEVWKYNPETLVREQNSISPVVDPLSLYLSMKDSRDERVEMALEQIIEKQIW
jgi:hypothetical protein